MGTAGFARGVAEGDSEVVEDGLGGMRAGPSGAPEKSAAPRHAHCFLGRARAPGHNPESRLGFSAGVARANALAFGLAFVIVSFSVNSVLTRWIVSRDMLDPGLTTVVRFVAGAVTLIPLARRAGGLPLGRRNVVPAAWLGSYAFLISYGYNFIGAAAGTFVFYATVLATMTFGGAALQHQRPAARAAVGGLVALSGVAVLAVSAGGEVTVLGVVLLAGTGLSWGAYSLLGRRHPDALAFTSGNFAVLGLVLLAPGIAWAMGWGAPVITAAGVVLAALMGSLTTALAYAVWYWSLARISPTQAGTYQMAIPVLSAAMGIGLLGEAWNPYLVMAGVLVLAGMALATVGPGTRR